jgi:hypothetical protein
MRYIRSCVVLALALVFATVVWAHHSTSAVFDMSKKLTVSGTLTKIEWVNPHIVVMVDVKKTDGAVENLKHESSPPSSNKNGGLSRNDFAKGLGQAVSIEANPSKDGSLYGYMRKISFADGRSFESVNAAEAAK